ncbi:MAG: NADH-quinone oxidoreductase subunit NuoB [Nitrospiraceae bacterium]|nr:NADH-quinone oxidoreductase subunit NuoB [Nitrospiraceae bacterium]
MPEDELNARADAGGILLETGPLAEKTGRVFRRSVRIRQVDAGSCNACEWECIALTNPVYDIQRFGMDFVASPRHADILLVTGPVSAAMANALKKTYNATPGPKLVIACGDCAKDGGIYKGSYAVTDGVGNIVPVDAFIPGCPPTPARIAAGIMKIVRASSKIK